MSSKTMSSYKCCKWMMYVALVALILTPLSSIMVHVDTTYAATDADASEEIIYIDNDGVIHVYDPNYDQFQVTWVSPKGGWKFADLGDVNADGDLEIVAIGTDPAGAMQIAVYDPVIASGVTDPNKEINGIPWDTLWETTLPGFPERILAGNFDNGIPGDEILYAYRDVNLNAIVVVLNADGAAPNGLNPDGTPTGRAWKTHVTYNDPTTGRRWKFGDSGDVNDVGSDEAVLVDSNGNTPDGQTIFEVFNVDEGFRRIDGKNTDDNNINKVAVGQIIAGGGEEIAEIRSAKAGGESLHVYKWDAVDNELNRDESWAFRGPEYVFLADLSGNGDDEVFILRKSPDDNGIRLIMVDEWGDDQDDWGENPDYPIEESLSDLPGGSDDAYKVGAGGDVDGDGRDEVILISDQYIIIYTDPQISTEGGATIQYLLPNGSNNDTLRAGDVDKLGFSKGPVFSVTPDTVRADVPTGTSRIAGTINLQNIGSNQSVNYSVAGLPAWATITPVSGNTPQNLQVRFDATNLPVGVVKQTIRIQSSSTVSNAPYDVDLVMTVTPAEVIVEPGVADVIYFPCSPPVTDTVDITLDVGGTAGLNFETLIVGTPQVGAASAGGSLSGEITGGMVDEAGYITLYDESGQSITYAGSRVTPEVSSSAAITIVNEVDWIVDATYLTNTVPSKVSLSVNPSPLGADFDLEHAALIIVADTRAGSPPDNIDIVPIMLMCAEDRVLAPILKVQ